jgi:hypothetical protein
MTERPGTAWARVMKRDRVTSSGGSGGAGDYSSARRPWHGGCHSSRPETSGARAIEKASGRWKRERLGARAETKADVQFLRHDRNARRGEAGRRAKSSRFLWPVHGSENAVGERRRDGESRQLGGPGRRERPTPHPIHRSQPPSFRREHTLKKDKLEDFEAPRFSPSHFAPSLPAHETPQHRLFWWLRLTGCPALCSAWRRNLRHL